MLKADTSLLKTDWQLRLTKEGNCHLLIHVYNYSL